jgi:hypothetical protein
MPMGFGGPGVEGRPGAGGNAAADAISNNNNGNTTATANATGGNGGTPGPLGTIGTAGNAIAQATATASGRAIANPTATTGIGSGGLAVAIGMATGNGGMTTATGFGMTDPTTRRITRMVNGRAVAPVPAGAMGSVQSQGQAAIAGSLPMLTPNTTLNAFGSAIAEPLVSDVLAASATAPNVVSALHVGTGGGQLGLVSLGGLYPTVASGASTTFIGSAAYTFDPTLLGGDLVVGLLDGQATGSGFDSLAFQILVNGAPVVQQDFTSVPSALTYFDDDVLDLGAVTALGVDPLGLLDVEFDLDVTAHNPGDGFAIDLAFAEVPEPSSLGLFGTAIAVAITLLGTARKRPNPM